MENREFPTTRSFGFGWETFTANIVFFIGLWAIIILVEVVVELIPYYAFQDNLMAEMLTSLVSTLVGCVIEVGVIAVVLRFVAGEVPEFNDLFSKMNVVFNYFLATIVFGVMVLIGLLLFIVPGVYIAIRFYFYGYFIVEEGAGPIEAISRSGDITRGHMVELLMWFLLMIGINILGLLALIVGIFITIPVTWVATAYVYRYLNPGLLHSDVEPGAPIDPQPV